MKHFIKSGYECHFHWLGTFAILESSPYAKAKPFEASLDEEQAR